MIEITHRWGLAKKGRWKFRGSEIQLPNVFFLKGKRFNPLKDADVTISKDEKSTFMIYDSFFETTNRGKAVPSTFGYPEELEGKLIESRGGCKKIQVLFDQELDHNAELYILGNAPQLLNRSKKIVERLVGIRKKIPFHKLIYAPGIAQPQNIALLTYLGVDLFDSASAEYFSQKNVELSDWIGFQKESPENNRKLLDELKLIRKAIETNKIRELVETRVRSEPWMVEGLRHIDKEYELVSNTVPVTGDKILVTTYEGLNRPDIERFRRRIKERYTPPKRDLLLLLPCSASKPYFQSRSHFYFRNALRDTNWTNIHEVILTSPLGVVPREIEQFYPAKQYDIPVTHEWTEEEKSMIFSQLQYILKKGAYKHIVSHLPSDLSFVSGSIDCIDTTNGTHPTDHKSLNNLSRVVIEKIGITKGDVQKFLKENMLSLAQFQFGKAGKRLLEGTKIKGRYPEYKIISKEDNTQRGMLVSERGLISLTLEGAEILQKEKINIAEIDDFIPKGSIFAVGVKRADSKIHPEDEVIVVHDKELRGVGPASMSGKEMTEANKGEAIRIRHYH
ncbi:MAG: DUF5591 domain-containing protein [Thermoplasmatota archaeon]